MQQTCVGEDANTDCDHVVKDTTTEDVPWVRGGSVCEDE